MDDARRATVPQFNGESMEDDNLQVEIPAAENAKMDTSIRKFFPPSPNYLDTPARKRSIRWWPDQITAKSLVPSIPIIVETNCGNSNLIPGIRSWSNETHTTVIVFHAIHLNPYRLSWTPCLTATHSLLLVQFSFLWLYSYVCSRKISLGMFTQSLPHSFLYCSSALDIPLSRI